MTALLPMILIASHVGLANRVPNFNIAPTCRFDLSSRDTCRGEEQQARRQLQKQWYRFSRDERSSCVQSTELGGYPSYVELLTCLQMAKEARALPRADKMNQLLEP